MSVAGHLRLMGRYWLAATLGGGWGWGECAPVSLDNVDEIISGGITAKGDVSVVNAVLRKDGPH